MTTWTPKMRWIVLVGMLIAALSGGCASKGDGPAPSRVLSIAEFATPRTNADTVVAVNPATTLPATSANSQPETVVEASPPRDAAGQGLLRPGEQVIVESVIGEVSGKPIFADDLLEPISTQLWREAQRMNRAEFLEHARDVVSGHLRQVLLSELVLAEAEASLTVQEQQGVLAILRDIRERTVALGGGSPEQTRRQLAEEFELTLEEYAELRKNEVLVQKLIDEKIKPRVIVSWQEVQREYELRKHEFNPPAQVTLKRIRLSNADQKELIDQAKERLKSETFEEVAASLPAGATRPMEPLPMRSSSISDIDVPPAFKPHLEGLAVGQTSQPFEDRGDTVWLHVAAIDQPPSKSLFDVQRQIIRELQIRRSDEERNKFIESLLEKGIYDETNIMLERALTVAFLRYAP